MCILHDVGGRYRCAYCMTWADVTIFLCTNRSSLSLHVRFGHLSSVFIVLYRPPTSPPNETFFVDIADVLEHTVSFAGSVVVGDINVHMDDTSSAHTARLVTLFDYFGLRDFVRQERLPNWMSSSLVQTGQPWSSGSTHHSSLTTRSSWLT